MPPPPRPNPWMSEGTFKNVKLLLVAESHYEDPYSTDLTESIVRKHGVNDGHGKTALFKRAHRAFTFGDDPPLSKADFWRSVSYCNYFSRIFAESNQRPTATDYQESAPSFDEVLSRLKPDAFVVMSRRVWNAMPNACEGVEFGGDARTAYSFTRDGKSILATSIPHPSSPGFSPKRWYPKLESFLRFVRQHRQ